MSTTTTPSSPTIARVFAPLAGATSLAMLWQAVSAGAFISRSGREEWVELHGAAANVTVVLALATAVIGVLAYRSSSRALVIGAVALPVLVVTQLVSGHLVADAELDDWIALHVPLALVSFGLTAWLVAHSAALRRAARR